MIPSHHLIVEIEELPDALIARALQLSIEK